jgi:hypothetical protein
MVISCGVRYGSADQLINLNYAKSGSSLGNLSYGYDNAGQRVQLAAAWPAPPSPEP